MSIDLVDYVNEPPQTNRFSDFSNMLTEIEVSSPIDQYITSSRSIISYGTSQRLDRDKFLGRLLLLGLISSAESYVRSILSSCLEMCPVCQKHAGEKNVNLGGILWHGTAGFSRSAFEHASFSSQAELKKNIHGFLAYQLTDEIFKVPLEEFEKICQLRHGIVHNDGILPGRNAVQLGVQKFSKPVSIVIDFSKLQEAAAVIDTLVVTLNRELFSEMCKRWAVDWRRHSSWKNNEEKKKFRFIWETFECKIEKKSRKGRSALSLSKCLDETKRKYDI